MVSPLVVSVVDASLDDLDVLVELAEAAESEARGRRGGELLVLSTAEPRSRLAEALGDGATRVMLVRLDATVVGYGVLRFRTLRDGRLVGGLDELYVEPEARGVGAGAGLLAEVVDTCRARRCVGLDAVALPGDRETKNFFESHGLTARALTVHRRLDGP